MSGEVMRYIAGTSIGLAGAAGFGLCLAKISSEDKRRNREFATYVMEHPKEYEEYKNVERFKQLENENQRLNSSVKSMREQLNNYKNEYDASMRQLRAYVDKDISQLEETKEKLKAYFGEDDEK